VTVNLDIVAPADSADVARFAALASRSLGSSSERVLAMLQRLGASRIRLARIGADLAGGLALLPMGHWFGGRAVPCVGISLVAVAPEHRSRGIGSELMRTALEEARRDGVALSSLFPATCPLYRAAGYQTAGTWTVYRMHIANLGSGARDCELRVATSGDHATMHALYDTRARVLAAAVDRSPYFWQRVLDPVGEEARAYVVEGPAGAEGYVVLSQRAPPGPRQPMVIVAASAIER
jgi:predicted acetyltransferase